MATCATGTARTNSASPFDGAQGRDRTVRVLRWTFRRQEEAVVCELGLNATDTAYELRIDPACNLAGVTTESFDDAMSAFERHAAIERLLVDGGWMLEEFESEQVQRPA